MFKQKALLAVDMRRRSRTPERKLAEVWLAVQSVTTEKSLPAVSQKEQLVA